MAIVIRTTAREDFDSTDSFKHTKIIDSTPRWEKNSDKLEYVNNSIEQW